MDRSVDLLDLAPELRELVTACEIAGQRSVFTRNGRPVAILVSYDEHLALRETIEIANNPVLRAQIQESEEQLARGAMLLPEDLDG